MARAALALLAMLALCGCVGLPVGHGAYLYAGIGVVAVDRQPGGVGVRQIGIGLTADCLGGTIGFSSTKCVVLDAKSCVGAIMAETGDAKTKGLLNAIVRQAEFDCINGAIQ